MFPDRIAIQTIAIARIVIQVRHRSNNPTRHLRQIRNIVQALHRLLLPLHNLTTRMAAPLCPRPRRTRNRNMVSCKPLRLQRHLKQIHNIVQTLHLLLLPLHNLTTRMAAPLRPRRTRNRNLSMVSSQPFRLRSQLASLTILTEMLLLAQTCNRNLTRSLSSS